MQNKTLDHQTLDMNQQMNGIYVCFVFFSSSWSWEKIERKKPKKEAIFDEWKRNRKNITRIKN